MSKKLIFSFFFHSHSHLIDLCPKPILPLPRMESIILFMSINREGEFYPPLHQGRRRGECRESAHHHIPGYGQAVSGELDGAQGALGDVSGEVLIIWSAVRQVL